MRGFATFALLALTALSARAAVDQTENPKATGEAVVNEVVARLVPGVFPFDYGFLRRLAVGGTDNGNDPPTTTEAPEVPLRQYLKLPPVEALADPIIWPLNKEQFELTQTSTDPKMVVLRDLIQKSHLNLNWADDVTFETDGDKPLHSAIATVLHAYSIQYGLGEELLPMLLQDQADFWATHFNPEADADAKQAFIEAVKKEEAEDDGVCKRALDVVFLFDISLTAGDIEGSKTLVKNLVLKYNEENARDTSVRFGLATYNKKGSTTPVEVLLNLTLSQPEPALSDVLNKITTQPGAAGEGDLAQGLKKAIEMHGAGNQVPEVIVLITSGFKTDFQDPELAIAIADAKLKEIRIIVLGLQYWDNADSEGIQDLVPQHFFIQHYGADSDAVADLSSRAIHIGSCQTERAPQDLPPSDDPREITFKAREIKIWSTDFAENTQEINFATADPGSGMGLLGWWCYDSTCSRPSEAVNDAILVFGQENKILPATGASKVLFSVQASTAEGTIHLTVKDVPKPTEPPTTQPPPTSPTTLETGPASGSTAPGPGSSPNPSEGTGETEPQSSSTLSSSTSSADKVIVGPVLVLFSILVLWFRV